MDLEFPDSIIGMCQSHSADRCVEYSINFFVFKHQILYKRRLINAFYAVLQEFKGK